MGLPLGRMDLRVATMPEAPCTISKSSTLRLIASTARSRELRSRRGSLWPFPTLGSFGAGLVAS